MKHLIIFGIIILGIVLLTLSYQLESKIDSFSNTNHLYLATSSIGGKYGRGVFSNKNFNVGDLIEQAPYIEDKIKNFCGITKDYVFSSKNGKAVLGFGYVSLYNHSDEPNASWKVDDKTISIKAIKPIQKDQEITISYGHEYWSSRTNLKKN